MKRRRRVAGGLLLGLLAVAARGQMHKVARPETVVRAVGVYEWTGDLAKPKGERLVPVTIFIDGQVQDAGVYLARPVPMALGYGTVYELDDAGVEKGLVDVKEARHVQLPAAADATPYDDGWFGYGVFEAPKLPRVVTKKATQQVAVNGKAAAGSDPDRPKFSSKSAPVGSGGSAADEGKPEAGSPEDVKVDSGSGDKDDVDRPTLRRRAPVDQKDAKKARKERDLSSVIPEKGSLNDDPDRPRMKRNAASAEDELAALNGLPADMKQMVAVSDPKRREPHPFARAWEDEAEHQAVLGKMRAMAQAELVAYGPVPAGTPVIAAAGPAAVGSPAAGTAGGATGASSSGLSAQDTSNGSAPVLRRNHVAANAAAPEQVTAPGVTAKPATPTAPAKATTGARTTAAQRAASKRRAAAAAAAAPAAGTVLADEEVKGFTLSYGGAATYVYTAHTVGAGAALRYVTVVAQEDGVNGLREAMHSVTDAAHLDRTPWMRFVDVVDVEASNRASLLFELRGQTARQFGLYRVIGGKADTLFLGGTTQ